jgi:ATP-dependent protease ClpP protease subunit
MNLLFIYTFLHASFAEFFNLELSKLQGKPVTVRLNSPGGSTFAGWSVIAQIIEHKGKKTLKIDGFAASFAPIFAAFFDHVSCLNVTEFIFHRAESFTSNQEEIDFLARINKNILAALKKKINEEKFFEITGKTLEDIFEAQEQFEVFITAEDALEIGLVDEVIDVLDEIKPTEVEASQKNVIAFHKNIIDLQSKQGTKIFKPSASESIKEQKNNIMAKEITTIEQVKTELPNVYTAIIAEGITEGIAEEKDRITAWVEFIDVAPKEVRAGINGTKAPGAAEAMKFLKISAAGGGSKKTIEENEEDNQEDLKTDLPEGSVQPGNKDSKKSTDDKGKNESSQDKSNKVLAEFEKEFDEYHSKK